MSEIKKCPVCNGRQTVPYSFYLSQITDATGDNSEVLCRSCDGKGYIAIDEFVPNYNYKIDPTDIMQRCKSRLLMKGGE